MKRCRLYDMHCHISFASNASVVAKTLLDENIGALSATVLPSEYEIFQTRFLPYPNITCGLGLHPWWVAGRTFTQTEIDIFASLAPRATAIAEVGLDFSSRFSGTEDTQIKTFSFVLDVCRNTDCKIISLHASNATSAVIDALISSGAYKEHICIFHRFSGSSKDLLNAIKLGSYFSLGYRMLATKRGKSYASVIPKDRLLLETDSPSQKTQSWNALHQISLLESALNTLEEIREEPLDDQIEQNCLKILSR